MKSRITKTVALAALVAGAAGTAHATEGWYGRADVGYSTGGGFDYDNGVNTDNDPNWTQHLGLGYAFQNGFRLEGEVGHRFNEQTDPAVLTADTHAWSAMLNLFYDFNRGSRVQPYIGVGVGGVRLTSNADFGAPQYDDQDTVLGYQALIGIGIGVTERLTFDVGYRALWAQGAEFTGVGGPFEGDYEHQGITLGLRWQFAGAAPPPPPPPPPPAYVPPPPPPPPVAAACPQSDFVVYFEWDRSNLNQAALEVIDNAVARARQCNVGSVIVVGHTDTSGSADYNQALSERRASVVRDALVARGINAGSISAQARGETDLARATRDGVREPLNRRTAVTITFR